MTPLTSSILPGDFERVSAGSTSYTEARNRGNVLLCLPREIRDEIYALSLTSDNVDVIRFDTEISAPTRYDRPNGPPPPLMQTCKHMYHEVNHAYISSLVLLIQNATALRRAEAWLESKKTLNAFRSVRAVVITDIDVFRKVSEKTCGSWWRAVLIRDGKKVDVSRAVFHPAPVQEFIPEGSNFLRRCPSLVHLELNFGIMCVPRFHCLQRRPPLYPGFGQNECSDPGEIPIQSILPPIEAIYDFSSLSNLPRLRTLFLHFSSRGICKKLMKGFEPIDAALRGKHDKEKARLQDGMGVKSWFGQQLEAKNRQVDIVCNYHARRPYPFDSDQNTMFPPSIRPCKSLPVPELHTS